MPHCSMCGIGFGQEYPKFEPIPIAANFSMVIKKNETVASCK